jgi:hypothetical protein
VRKLLQNSMQFCFVGIFLLMFTEHIKLYCFLGLPIPAARLFSIDLQSSLQGTLLFLTQENVLHSHKSIFLPPKELCALTFSWYSVVLLTWKEKISTFASYGNSLHTSSLCFSVTFCLKPLLIPSPLLPYIFIAQHFYFFWTSIFFFTKLCI